MIKLPVVLETEPNWQQCVWPMPLAAAMPAQIGR